MHHPWRWWRTWWSNFSSPAWTWFIRCLCLVLCPFSYVSIPCWVIAASTEIVEDMVVKLQQSNAVLVYQMLLSCSLSYVSVLCCVIAASTEIVEDMVVKLQQPNVALVHQMPFSLQAGGMASTIEKVSSTLRHSFKLGVFVEHVLVQFFGNVFFLLTIGSV